MDHWEPYSKLDFAERQQKTEKPIQGIDRAQRLEKKFILDFLTIALEVFLSSSSPLMTLLQITGGGF